MNTNEHTATTPQDAPESQLESSRDEFTNAYIEAMLWSTDDDEGTALCATYTPDDIAPASMQEIETECAEFHDRYCHLWEVDDTTSSRAGHDFWLTRNGHGAGFWDGDYPINGDALTEAAHQAGERTAYIGDDGMIYLAEG